MYNTNTTALTKVEEGEIWVTIAPHDGALRLIWNTEKKGFTSPLTLVWPESGAISAERQIAIVKKTRSAGKTEIVRKFIDFSISEEGQKISSKFAYLPVREMEIKIPGLPEEVYSYPYDWISAGKNEDSLKEAFQEIFRLY